MILHCKAIPGQGHGLIITNYGMKHAPGAGSFIQPGDLQFSTQHPVLTPKICLKNTPPPPGHLPSQTLCTGSVWWHILHEGIFRHALPDPWQIQNDSLVGWLYGFLSYVYPTSQKSGSSWWWSFPPIFRLLYPTLKRSLSSLVLGQNHINVMSRKLLENQ